MGRNAVELAIVFAVVLFLGYVHATGMSAYPARFDDEGAYMSQAWAVLTRFDLAHYTYWYDHPPLGWILIAIYSLFTGALERASFGVAAGREAMLLFHLASTALLFVLARRLGMKILFAVLVVLIFGLSPLGIFYHRMVLLDNVALPLLLASFVLLLSPRKRLSAHVAAALCFALAVLVRETFLLFLPAAIYLYRKRTDPRTRRYSLALTVTTFLGMLSLYPLFALLRGELVPSEDRVSLFESIGWQLFGREGSGSVFDRSSPAAHVVAGWVQLDPWILVLGLIAVLVTLVIPRFRWIGITGVLLALMLTRPGYLPVMYVVSAIPFLALAVGGVLDEGWKHASATDRVATTGLMVWVRRVVMAGAVVALIGGMWIAYRPGVANAMSADADAQFRGAQAWLEENLEPDDIVLLDSALWLDVVRQGHPPENTVWYYKLDTDPAVELPGDWRAVDYVVTTEVIRTTTYELPNVEAVIENSEVVAVFGEGPGQVEIKALRAP